MPSNIEIKARVRDFNRLKQLAEEITDKLCELIKQKDIYFDTTVGKLKLRIFTSDHGELVYYKRNYSLNPKRSDYIISKSSDPNSLEAVLTASLGIRGIVSKERYLYMVGNTRIHLDKVEGLGSFVELEVVLDEGESTEDGEGKVIDLMVKLGIEKEDLVEGSYIDILEGTGNQVLK